MKQQLQATPNFHCVNARGMYNGLYIFLLMICGTAYSQPAMVSPIATGSKNFVYVGGSLYYSEAGNLYKASATSAPVLVTNTGENILRIYNLALGSSFFFITQGGSGQRLWRSDGTAANTLQVTTATQITPLLVYNSQLYLRISASDTGIELWKVDGAYNASLVKDINPGTASGFAGSLMTHDGLLYFFANAGAGTDLWKSNGTTAGTVLSADLDDTEVYNSSGFTGLTSYNDSLYFTRDHEDPYWGERTAELWKSDGTTEGTTILLTYTGGNSYNYLRSFVVFQGKLYFFHGIGDPQYVWFSVTDGTVAGTEHLELVTIDGELLQLIDAEAYLLYFSHSQSFTNPIEKFDGAATTTVHEFSMYHSAPSLDVVDLTYTNGRAFFLDDVNDYTWPQSSMQLFQADLATGVTRPVQEIYSNVSLYNSYNITAANGSIFFTRTVSGETTLWYYDPSGTPPSCEGTGNILQEIWVNVPGSDVRTFDFTSAPTGGTRPFTSFETTQYYANNYASRMRGTICVPQSGFYTFWISSDDQSELYLSTGPYEENKRLIAWVYGYTQFRNYDKYPSQKSAQIYLEADRKYYIEARHKEANGNDFVSVGWQLPDGTMQRPIPGNRLSAVTTPPNQPPAITIISPQDNQTFPPSSSVTIEADVNDPDGVSNVQFTHLFTNGGTTIANFSAPPYVYQWNNLAPGTYQVRVTARDNRGAQTSKDVFFIIQDEPCEGTGTIVREIWRNIPGTSVSSIPVDTDPYNIEGLTSLSTPNYYANDYGSRIRGYLCVPESGVYTFWISGDDNSELWLSTNDSPENKTRIAYVTGATRVNQWDKYTTQQSAGITLAQGQRYYVEVLHKEANGADHVEVGWLLPSGAMERPIPGNRLIPFDPSTSAARFAGVEEVIIADEETTFAVYPNPAVSGKQVAVKLPFVTEGPVDVDIKSITGVSVQREMLSVGGDEVLIDLKPSIATGMYLIRVANEKGNWSTKLQVK